MIQVQLPLGLCNYRPPNGNFHDAISEFEGILTKLPKKNVSIMGDFNVNLLTGGPESHYAESSENIGQYRTTDAAR